MFMQSISLFKSRKIFATNPNDLIVENLKSSRIPEKEESRTDLIVGQILLKDNGSNPETRIGYQNKKLNLTNTHP